MPDWNKRLRAARRDLGLRPADLAARAGVSEASVRAYETGRRHPTREHLSWIMECLRLDRQTRNELFIDAGLAPDAVDAQEWSLTRRDVNRLLHDRPWPAYAVNEVMEVLAGSRAGMRLAGITPKDLEDRVERNVVVIAADVVAARPQGMRDWGIIAQRAIGRMKAAGVGTVDNPDPYFAALLDRIGRRGPNLLHEFTAQWEATSPESDVLVSRSFPAQWTLRSGAVLRLHCLATRVSVEDQIEIFDLIPADAESAGLLERVVARRQPRQS